MKKKILSIIIICSILFIGACSNNNEESEVNNNNTNTNTNTNSESTNSNEYSDIDLYSDDTKIVFIEGNSKLVFYYEGNEITKHCVYIDYGDSYTANMALNLINNDEEDKTIEKAYVQGKYLIVEYAKEEYENTTLEDVKTAYSILEQAKKGN